MHGCIDGREHPRHGAAMDSLLEAAGVFRLDATGGRNMAVQHRA